MSLDDRYRKDDLHKLGKAMLHRKVRRRAPAPKSLLARADDG